MAQLREHFGKTREIKTIEQRHAETFMATRKRKSGHDKALSSWSLAHHLKHARAIFGAGVEWGYLERSPFAPPTSKRNTALRIQPKSRPWQHVSPDEFLRMIAVVPTTRRRACYWLMYGCGLRAGEVYNLTIDQIDLDGRRVHIETRTPTDDIPGFTVKSEGRSAGNKSRSVPIPEAAIPDLTTAMQEAFKSGGFIALSPERFVLVRANWRLCREGKPWGDRETHRPWRNADMVHNLLRDTKAYLRKAEVDLTSPFTLHTLRKSFAQNHADNGTPPRTLAKLLGHSDVRVTMTFYNQATDANEREAICTMDRVFAGKHPKQRATGAC